MAEGAKAFPKHVAIIMDGNGRWGVLRKKNRFAGHRAGAMKVREILNFLRSLKVQYVTLYAFSTENWKRPRWEINGLMRLLSLFSQNEIQTFVAADTRVRFIGRRDRLRKPLLEAMQNLERATAGGSTMLLQVAVDYGGRDELLRVIKTCVENRQSVATESDVAALLDTHLAPDPDLVIRTGGERRLSNFMLWQLAYAEFCYTDTLWPDFKPEELKVLIDDYCGVDRRFGGLSKTA